jgi:hypothetical protein
MRRKCIRLLCACALVSMSAAGAYAQTAQDSAVAQQVASTIKESGQLSNYRLGVKYQDGVAWLLGTVADEQQMNAAIALAEQVDGVNHVICKLEIDSTMARSTTASTPRESRPTMPMPRIDETIQQPQTESRVMPATANTAARQPMRQAPMGRVAQAGGQPLPMSAMQANAVRSASYQQGQVAQAGCYGPGMVGGMGGPQAMGHVPGGGVGVNYDNAQLPGYAWPSYAAYPNYSALTYPKQYSPTAWPYIGPFYPYPQVPLGWRKVTMEWDDGWWMLDFSHSKLQ